MWHLWLPMAHLYMCATAGRLCTLHENLLSAQASWPCKVGWQQVSRSEAILMMVGWSMALVQIKKGYSWQNCSLTHCLSTMQSLLGLSFSFLSKKLVFFIVGASPLVLHLSVQSYKPEPTNPSTHCFQTFYRLSRNCSGLSIPLIHNAQATSMTFIYDTTRQPHVGISNKVRTMYAVQSINI